MPIVENTPDSGQELRWREWQEKGRRNDRMADKRIKVMFFVVSLILLAWILYHALQPRMSADSDYVRRALSYDHNSILIALRPANVIRYRCSSKSQGLIVPAHLLSALLNQAHG